MDSDEQLIADSLSKHAADAPSDDRLLDAVHARLHRRRTGRTLGAVVVAAAAVATAITASHTQLHSDAPIAQNLGPGWRWESFKTVQVQVPSSWTQYISGPAPCTSLADVTTPTIGRLNGWPASRQYTCQTAVLPLDRRAPYLWFNDVQAPGIKRYDAGWTEETREVGGVRISVLTKDNVLRRQILDSARPVTGTDHYGCSPRQPVSNSTGNPTLQVTSASICEYWQGSLIAGSEVPSAHVSELAGDLLNLGPPTDPGPVPADCQDSAPRVYVVLLQAGDRTWPITYEHSYCTTLRPRILDLVQTGPHRQIQPADIVDLVKPIPSLPR